MRGIIRSIKRLLKVVIGKDFYDQVDCQCKTDRLGSGYGGWDVIPGLLDKQSVVYSFGIGEDVSFDLALIDRFDLKVEAFDPTPKSIAYVKKLGVPSGFKLHEYGIADFDGRATFLHRRTIITFRIALLGIRMVCLVMFL